MSSLESSKEFLEQPKCELHQIYRALEVIAKENDFFQSELYKNSQSVINRKKDILYYDCTNYYFYLYIEDTGIFTRIEWNTYCSILHIQVPLETHDIFVANSKLVLDIAQQLFGRQGDQYLTDIDIGILVEHYEIIDFSEISLTQVISKAVNDAELLMQQRKYDSAFDRVHTAFHG